MSPLFYYLLFCFCSFILMLIIHKLLSKKITLGKFVESIFFSLIPVVNIIIVVMGLYCLYEKYENVEIL